MVHQELRKARGCEAHDLLETLGKEGLTSEKPGSREVDYVVVVEWHPKAGGTMPMALEWQVDHGTRHRGLWQVVFRRTTKKGGVEPGTHGRIADHQV